MQVTGPLAWRDTPNAFGPVASVAVSFALDPVYRVQTRGGLRDRNYAAQVLVVDNTTNAQGATITINGVSTLVSANVRSNYPLPIGAPFIDITSPAGSSCALTFFADHRDVPPDLPNFAAIIQNTVASARVDHGNIRGAKVGANILYSPYNGRSLVINAAREEVPAGGFSIAPVGGANAFRYHYAFMNAGVMTGEASATGHQIDATSGVEVKIGDASRTLVGCVCNDAAGTFTIDDTNARFLNWFNRRALRTYSSTGGVGTGALPWVKLNAASDIFFLTWADEMVRLWNNANASLSVINTIYFGESVDGVAPLEGAKHALVDEDSANFVIAMSLMYAKGFTEGALHTASIIGGAGAGVATFSAQTSHQVEVMG